ncbi:hypothetical protein RCZ04_09410 [Capnocytophaga sp. HP1101]
MKVLPLLALFPLSLIAQNPIPAGSYKATSLGNALELRIGNNNTYELIGASGNYTLKDKRIEFISDTSSFLVEKKQSNSPKLQITFKIAASLLGDPRFLYVGYENNKGEVEYVCVHNKITSLENIEKTKDSNGISYYVLESFEVPRTENLYLVNAHSVVFDNKSKEVIIEKFPIGKSTNAVEVEFLGTNNILNLKGTYNPDKGTISLTEGDSDNAILFSGKASASNPAEVARSNKENVKNWKHLIAFEEEKDIPEYNPEKRAKEKTQAVVSIPKNLNAALASADKHSRLVIVFQQPDNKEAQAQFKALFAKYQEEGSSNDYEFSDDKQYKRYPYELYLATAKDMKTLKAKGVPTGNQMAVLDVAGNLLYSQPSTVEEAANDEILTSYAYGQQFGTMAMARALDKALSNPKLSVKALQEIFITFLKKDSQRVYLLAKNRPEHKTGDSNEEEQFDYIAQEQEDYFSELKNQKGIYQMQLTPQQATAQWERVVNAHKKDSKLDAEYALLLALNNTGGDYYYRIFNAEKPTSSADIDAIAYLVKFADEIKAHNEKLVPKDDDYLDYQQRLEKGVIEYNKGNLSTQLDRIGANDKSLFNAVKTVYTEGVKKNLFTADDYIDFLYENNVEEASAYFGQYYKNLLQRDSNLIAALDKAFSEDDDDNSWKYYKMRFANRANNIAWKVYEENRNNPAKLTEPYQWATSAVQLEPENPYYLDTLAHLLYARGEKQEAIKLEEKAVKLLSTTDDEFESQREEVKANLKKMKQGE